jgi:ATP-dependent Clp protease ATP-binding subunit ClpX
MEEIMLEVMFEIPSRQDIKKCVITKDVVEKKITPLLITDNESPDFLADEEKLA